MGPKKANESIKVNRNIVRTTIEVKKEIIHKHENGVCIMDLALQFSLAKKDSYLMFLWKGTPLPNNNISPLALPHQLLLMSTLLRIGMVKLN